MPEETMERVKETLKELEKPTEPGQLKRKLGKAYSVFSQINELPIEHRKQFITRLEEAAKTHERMDETLAIISAIEYTEHHSNKAALKRLQKEHPTQDGKNFANEALMRLKQLE